MILIILGCSEKDFVEDNVLADQQDAYACFSETPDEPVIIHAVPYTSDAGQATLGGRSLDDGSQMDSNGSVCNRVCPTIFRWNMGSGSPRKWQCGYI